MATLGRKGKWTDLLDGIIYTFNSQKIRGTTFKRKDIGEKTYYKFLEEKFGVQNFTSLLNTSKINAKTIKNKKWLNKMFRFKEDQKVLASYKVLNPTKVFRKISERGYYSDEVYKISSRYLASTKSLDYTPGEKTKKKSVGKFLAVCPPRNKIPRMFRVHKRNEEKAARLLSPSHWSVTGKKKTTNCCASPFSVPHTQRERRTAPVNVVLRLGAEGIC